MKKYDFASLPGIDAEAGLLYSEQEDTYAAVLGDFHRFIKKYADIIENAVKEHDEDDYVREVHKLKSSARLIGATALSELALELEAKGKEGDWSAIEKGTPTLLEKYREYLDTLSDFDEPRPEATEGELSEKELSALLLRLKDTLSAFDYDASMSLAGELQRHVLPERMTGLCGSMRESLESFEFDDALNYVNQMLK